MKILIAEDDPNTSRLYSTLLRRSGHQFVLTENGEDCLIIYNNEFFGDELLNMLNDTTLYEKLKKSVIDVEPIKKARLRHEQLKALTDLLEKIDRKNKTG